MRAAKPTERPELQTAMVAYTILAVLFAIFIFALPANRLATQAYHVTSFQYRVVLFSVALPSILVWFAAFWGYAKLRQYAAHLQAAAEGEYYMALARGCTWLAWSLPVTAIVTLAANAAMGPDTHLHPAAVVISNYVKLIPPLIAFTLIGNAARGLVQHSRIKLGLMGTRLIMLLFVLIGVLYCYLVFRHMDLTMGLGNSHNLYFMPVWLVVVTIAVPYLYAWFVGLLAAYEISLFSQKVHGVLYRRALRMLAGGLVLVLGSSMVVQYISGLQVGQGYLVLDSRLLFLTIFRILNGIGFLLIAFGADQLKKLEDL